jgi:hypothetical protein
MSVHRPFARVVAVVAVNALIACAAAPSAPSAATGSLSLQANTWEMIANSPALRLENDAAGHLVFDFPASGSMNYLYNVHPPQRIGGTLSVSLQVTTDGPVVFNYMTEAINTCATPASVRPFIWAYRNSPAEFDRWWSNPTGYTLAAGTTTLSIPLSADRWSSVFGKFGNADAAAQAGFASAIRNVSSLGLTFGGGCFFGHGVYVQGGRAQFALVGYQIQN